MFCDIYLYTLCYYICCLLWRMYEMHSALSFKTGCDIYIPGKKKRTPREELWGGAIVAINGDRRNCRGGGETVCDVSALGKEGERTCRGRRLASSTLGKMRRRAQGAEKPIGGEVASWWPVIFPQLETIGKQTWLGT
jgi:hypothetical protein